MKKLIALLIVAAAAAFLPVPAAFLEREYSGRLYPAFQSAMTAATNRVPIAMLDVTVGLIVVLLAAAFVRVARRDGALAAARRTAASLLATVGIVYLLFLATWGLNYRRVPLEEKLDFDRGRVNEAAAARLAAVAIAHLNEGYADAHSREFSTERLEDAFFAAQMTLDGPRHIEPGRPKSSVLQPYFRRAAIDGMTVPVFLEVILNPDLLPVEMPFTLAHEWAHLAGYADESEANFVAWYACVTSRDPLLQYSGWMDAYVLSVNALPRHVRRALPQLMPGPREDLRSVAARYERASPRVRRIARVTYDSYLKANRVEEGIESYGAALQLMLGARFQDDWRPVLRSR